MPKVEAKIKGTVKLDDVVAGLHLAVLRVIDKSKQGGGGQAEVAHLAYSRDKVLPHSVSGTVVRVWEWALCCDGDHWECSGEVSDRVGAAFGEPLGLIASFDSWICQWN
jgi:hypothetical protein